MNSSVAWTILGLDIGGAKTAVVEGDENAVIYQRRELSTEAAEPFEKTFSRLADAIELTIAESERAGRMVRALSVAVGGPLNIGTGQLLNPPHLPGWHGVRLKDRLARRFDPLPVFVEHDGNAGALAEFRFGLGRAWPNLQHLIFLTFGTGLGAGIIVNGQILHGATDTAGEVGHFRLAQCGPSGYGKAGSWEGFASGTGLVQLASFRFPERWTADTPIESLMNAMLAGDPDALAVAAEAGTWMGRGMALLIDAFNPEIIAVGSLAMVLGERLMGPARRAIADEALPQAAAACELLPSALGKSVGDVSALMAALTGLERDGEPRACGAGA
jgi:glucokinase